MTAIDPPDRVPSAPDAHTSPRIYGNDYDQFHRSVCRFKTSTLDVLLSEADCDRFQKSVLEKIGLDFANDRPRLLKGLAEVMDMTACTSLDQFYALLSVSPRTSSVWDRLVSILTIGETYFFRNTNHFDALAKYVLPSVLAEREHGSRRIRIWSAGCASGEEPYSVAILLREMIPHPESWNIVILATDINRDALRRAQDGLYGAWSFRGVEKRIQDTYFQQGANRMFAISDTIKRMVTFEYLNLVQDPYPSLANNTNAMDIILCRNVTIYFTPQVIRATLGHFRNCLVDGGWLIPGAAEPNLIYYNDFTSHSYPGAVVYQRPLVARQEKRPGLVVAPRIVPAPVAPPSRPATPPPSALPNPPVSTGRTVPPETAAPAASQKTVDPYEAALAALQTGQVEEALVKLCDKLDQNPDFVPTYYTLGKIYANKGNLEEAQVWCERAIQKDKLHPEPYFTLSMVYQQHGLLDKALDALKKTVYLDREFVLGHFNLAQIYRRLGDPGAALRSLQNVQRLLETKPRDEVVPEGDGLIVGRFLELVKGELEQKN